MEDLRGLVLDGLHLHLVRRVLPLAVPQRLLQPLRRVQRDRVPPRPQELIKVLKNILVETNISLSGTNIFIWNKFIFKFNKTVFNLMLLTLINAFIS